MEFEFLVLFSAVYNIWFGAICWILFGILGLLIGSIFMVGAVIIGVLLKNYKREIGEKKK
ncbi:MAG TPA: hypothetical protein VMZ91_03105 [Candidatus Paceibacterota bacterium]|nr:hypothetical protein [Candidatus Paceibacterota bacterium]